MVDPVSEPVLRADVTLNDGVMSASVEVSRLKQTKNIIPTMSDTTHTVQRLKKKIEKLNFFRPCPIHNSSTDKEGSYSSVKRYTKRHELLMLLLSLDLRLVLAHKPKTRPYNAAKMSQLGGGRIDSD